ncbi:MAG: ArsR/SmtB family transcription factor [Arthrobacter sp.]|uniref:ArsR/SmtB family transcription factor n=1 Tax=unclassified Arthrobacter TaxID=235627 RepID=UPI00264BFBEB|nr:metalloregulator ArsR/SmtB family transcription factor [Micrococcaceae bacterium]MDN5824536.1 metalloregulator ArsR/SmtB family transcription factor [Micrococcaceae bacterium]MDN5879467.1 metalloregulator ArsR/SmtB family transcription factor [Micrococcaceae bacterium]MDN5906123.1 metalloregulator ArsR/SmtB family transcription factor [Micrococcaceae bacterium]MDN6169100.1 metalloregulator ArsR/SmtB family transcription factor [Micrococcaceae bacterium]
MTMIMRKGEPTTGPLAPAAALFHGLADPTRLLILRHLRTGEHKVRELTEHLGLAQSTVSAHLTCLRDCGLVSSRPVGRASMYSLAEPEHIDVLLLAAETLLADSGNEVALAAHHWHESHRTGPECT